MLVKVKDVGILGLHNTRGNCKWCYIRSVVNETILIWAQVLGRISVNLFGKKGPAFTRVSLMKASGATTVLWELLFGASTALLLFLSSESHSFVLYVLSMCTVGFSCCDCKSLVTLRFQGTCIHLRTLCSCLHACQVVRVCCHRALIFEQSSKIECLYLILIKFCMKLNAISA